MNTGNDRWFLGVLAVHIVAGLVAVITGIAAMVSTKTAGRHPRMGTLYVRALFVVTVTMTVLSALRWPADNYLFLLGIVAFTSATLGRRARRKRGRHWVVTHVTLMGTSYIVMLTAFYVDNGPNLPLWNRLPPLAFWLLPGIVGFPIVGMALRRYRHIPL